VTEQELSEWVREQLAAYKYPRVIEFRDALPTSATGKVLKRELR
jgi:long-chain acyl-CoA synthetase